MLCCKKIHFGKINPFLKQFLIFHIITNPPVSQFSQGYFLLLSHQRTIRTLPQCQPGAFGFHGEIICFLRQLNLISSIVRDYYIKIIVAVFIISTFCKRTEQVNPFRHYCQADSVFDCINLIVNHPAHILSNRLAWIVPFIHP